jgi:hypothetical protein
VPGAGAPGARERARVGADDARVARRRRRRRPSVRRRRREGGARGVRVVGGGAIESRAHRASRVVRVRRELSGAFYTLVPIRPRWRGERRSLRTLPGASLRPSHAFNPRHRRLSTPSDAFQLHPDVRSYGTALSGATGRSGRRWRRGCSGAGSARRARAARGRARIDEKTQTGGARFDFQPPRR